MAQHNTTPRYYALSLLALLSFSTLQSKAQTLGDFRSAGSGPWNAASTWERFNGTNFVAAVSSPSAADGVITIRNGHAVTANTAVTADQVQVATGGTLTITSVTFTVVDGPGVDLSVTGTLSLNGALAFAGSVEVSGTLSCTAGNISGAGSFTLMSGSTANFQFSSSFTLNTALTNNGTINWTGGALDGTGSLTNGNGGIINRNVAGVNSLQVNFINLAGGTFNYSGLGDFNSLAPINNAGTININSGNWRISNSVLNSGTIALAAGAVWTIETPMSVDLNVGTVLSGSGNIVHSAGTVNQNFPWTNSTFNFTRTGGFWSNSISNPTVFAVGSTLTWNGGTFAGPASYTINSGLTATFSPPTSISLASAMINNGTINWTSATIDGAGTFTNSNGATINRTAPGLNHLWVNFVNQAGGMFNYSGAGEFSSLASINNAGTFNINSGHWRSSSAVVNSGTIALAAGTTWTIEGAQVDLNAGTVLSGSGNIVHSAGTVNQNFPWTNSTHNFTKTGGFWSNSTSNPTVFAVGSTLTWNGGTFAGPASYTINSGLSATFSPTISVSLASNMINNGTINWTSAVMDGAGTLTNSNGATINRPAPGVNHLQASLNNQAGGTFNYTGSGAFSTLFGTVTNAGAINALSGTFTFDANSTHTGTLNISAGAIMNFATTATVGGTVNNAGTFSGNISGYTGPNFTNNGSVTLTNLSFNGSAAQALNGNGTISSLTINNASGVSLGGDQSITNTLTLTTGELALGANDLFVESVLPAAVSGGNAGSFVTTTGTGALHRQANGANYVFPVGIPSSYLPLTLGTTAGGQERFAVRVQNGVSREYTTPGNASGALLNSDVVGRTWVVLEQNAGGSTADITLQWNTADELPSFGRSLSAVARYDGTNWIASSVAAAGGAGPFTRSISGITSFREFCVTDGDALLNDISTSLATPIRDDLSIFPNPCSDVLYVEPSSGGAIRNMQLVDLSGRTVSTSVHSQSGRTSLATNHLPNGTYVLEVLVEGDEIRRSVIVVSH